MHGSCTVLPCNPCGYWLKTSEKWWTLMNSVFYRDSELPFLEQMLRQTDGRDNETRIMYLEKGDGLPFSLLIQRLNPA